MAETADVIVVGAGIAGVGLAAHLADRCRVVLLETEARPGYHASGRSAAIFLKNYGNPAIRALTAASETALVDPDPALTDRPLLSPRGSLMIAAEHELAAFAAHMETATGVEEISPDEAVARFPLLRRETIVRAAYEDDARDMDADRLMQGWVRMIRRRGGRIADATEALRIERTGALWRVAGREVGFEAPVVVNAAGAWADMVAERAGLAPLGLRPLRRSAAIVRVPEGHDPRGWPEVGPASEDWYAKPDAGRLMVSPADEDPVDPHDAWADDMVLAEGLDRFEQAMTMPVTRIEGSWAGLRTFAPDRTPVAGYDPVAEGFFWLAGQGGYGIQTAPALSRLAAALVLGEAPEAALVPLVAALSPARFRAKQTHGADT